ncbi:hypothetical protein LguiA_019868 [Lonicera macranthoides]
MAPLLVSTLAKSAAAVAGTIFTIGIVSSATIDYISSVKLGFEVLNPTHDMNTCFYRLTKYHMMYLFVLKSYIMGGIIRKNLDCHVGSVKE